MQRFVQVTQRKSPRLAFIAGVAATHVVLIVTFLLNDKMPVSLRLPEPKEITLILRRFVPATPPARAAKKTHEKSNAITLPPFLRDDTLGKLGQYLACQSNYDTLSAEERARCALAPWTPGDPNAAFMLGVEPPSIWAQALAERKAPFVPMFGRCEVGAIGPDAERSRLGLACMKTDPEQAKRWGDMLH